MIFMRNRGFFMTDSIKVCDLTVKDVPAALALWLSIPELHINKNFDTEQRIRRFIEHNPGLSSAAFDGDLLVGALLCGQDGRRGFIYHIGVLPNYRRRGIARRMAHRSFEALRAQDIDSCFLFTYEGNFAAQNFWKSIGFEYAPHVMYHSKSL